MPIPVEGNKREDVVFPIQLTVELEGFLYDTNPWWRGKSMRPVPPFRRWLFEHILQRLQRGLTPVTVVRGPRQVGKTTLQHQIIEHLLYQERVNPNRIFRVQFDEIPSLMDLTDPILSLCRWFESRVLSGTFNEWARKGEPIYLFFGRGTEFTKPGTPTEGPGRSSRYSSVLDRQLCVAYRIRAR